jgi:hypothetical protein
LAASDLDARLTTICEHFKEDLDRDRLQTNFAMLLPELMDGKTETPIDSTDALHALGPAKRLYDELVKPVGGSYAFNASNVSNSLEQLQCHSSA